MRDVRGTMPVCQSVTAPAQVSRWAATWRKSSSAQAVGRPARKATGLLP